MKFLNVINVRVDKQEKPVGYDPFERAWEALRGPQRQGSRFLAGINGSH